MIRDRKALLEQEIEKSKRLAAAMYLKIVTGGGAPADVEYQKLKDKISNFEFDLGVVNQLILDGHK